MASFVTTDGQGQFILDGKPWFFHGSSYFGRRPGTCGANWLSDQDFDHNFALLPGDLEKMKSLGLNVVGLFLPGHAFFNGIEPNPVMFERLDRIVDTIAEAGLHAVVFPNTPISRDVWCQAHGIDPGNELWNAAVNADAERCKHYSILPFVQRYAGRPEVLGFMGRVGRFDFIDWDPPTALASPVHSAWYRWLEERFHGDFHLARELLELKADETDWTKIRLPQETPPNFSRQSPRACEYGTMQHVLISRANDRLNKVVKAAAPQQLMITDMEGVEFPIGLINVLVPELATADALWLECYNWEGMRGYQVTSDRHQAWLVEPNCGGKRAIDVVGNAGYVQMLIRLMQQSHKALIICHGTDIGEEKRGVRTESEQALMIDRFNAYIRTCGAHGIDYWCFTDDELSKSATLPAGFEFTLESTNKEYEQAGETMGILRFDGSERPVSSLVRSTSRSIAGKPAATSPHEALVLFPTPIFQSLYRYRSNVTGFGLFTSLARQGILADAMMTSAGEDLVTLERLSPYKAIILGMPEYHRDHPEIPAVLQAYVEQGGTLVLPLADPEKLDDPYIKPRQVPALRALAGCAAYQGRELRNTLHAITSSHPNFVADLTRTWTLPEDGWFTRVTPVEDAEILAMADGDPLLYRHRIGQGCVYIFTWNLDVLLFKGGQLDYLGGNWDWLWQGLAMELDLSQDLFNPMTRAIREMSYQAF